MYTLVLRKIELQPGKVCWQVCYMPARTSVANEQNDMFHYSSPLHMNISSYHTIITADERLLHFAALVVGRTATL